MTAEEELDEAQLAYLQLLVDAGCKFVFKSYYPQGEWAQPKSYVMMKDRLGTHFLERMPEEMPTGISLNGQTGEVELVQ